MTAGPVRLGILGTASIVRRRLLPALGDVPELRLVAVASRDPDRAAALATQTGADPVCGYERLLSRADVDAVYLPVPNAGHFEWAAEALRRHKHVLVEKPATPTAELTASLVDLARAGGLVLAENFAFLHHRQHRIVAESLASGEIGELREVEAVFGIPPLDAADIRYRPELAGGCLLDVGVYPIRVAQWLLGPGLRVCGATAQVDPRTGVDIAGAALLCAPSGVPARLGYGFSHHYRNRYTLWGSSGTMTVRWAFSPPPHHRAEIVLDRPDRSVTYIAAADDQFANAARWFAQSVKASASCPPHPPGGAEGGVSDPVAGATPDATVETARLVDAVRSAAGLSMPICRTGDSPL
jgi:NDP-hexose-3-ketoreductase